MPAPKLTIRFFRLVSGREPVRDWLKALPEDERRIVGTDLRTLQFGWPLGMPLVRKLAPDLWEVRCHLPGRIARMLFTVAEDEAVLLHGFIKKAQATPRSDLALAVQRLKELQRSI